MRNDLSFIFDDELNLYEHNSTPCPNIALRDLLYIASSYREMYSLKDLYKSSPIKIPAPRFFVFYNGTLQLPDRFEYRLSDMFIKETANPGLELKITVLNVNEGRNKELMESCKSLRDYSLFVGKVKYTQETKLKNSKDYFMSHKKELIEKAVIKAIDECITENILRDYFIQNRQEARLSVFCCSFSVVY